MLSLQSKRHSIWPYDVNAGLKKMRSYGKKKKSLADVKAEDTKLDLPELPSSRPHELWNTAAAINSFIGRDPTQFSDNSREIFGRTVGGIKPNKPHNKRGSM